MKTQRVPKNTREIKKQSRGSERAEKIKRAEQETVSRYFLNQQIHTCWRASPAPLNSCFVTEGASYSCITHVRECSGNTSFAVQLYSTRRSRKNVMLRNFISPRQDQSYSHWLINQYILVTLDFMEGFPLQTRL